MKKLIVAYRDNDLFRKYIPDMLSQVPSGIDIEKIIFPARTDIDDIEKELTTKLKEIEVPFLYLSDRTCTIFLNDEALRRKCQDGEINIIGYQGGLDEGFSQIVKEIFETRDFVAIFKNIAKTISKEPSVIYVIVDGIADHLYRGFQDADELFAEYRRSPRNPIDPYKFAEFLKGILEGLYPGIEVRVKKDILAFFYADPFDQEHNVLLVADRHCDSSKDAERGPHGINTFGPKKKLFLLPFENAIAHLIMIGRIGGEELDSSVLYERIFAETDFA